MVILYIILALFFLVLLIRYCRKNTLFDKIPWLWENVGRPLRDYILNTTVRKITLAYFTVMNGLTFSLPIRKISAFLSDGRQIGWLSFELDDGNIDLWTTIIATLATISYYIFLRHEARKLDASSDGTLYKIQEDLSEIKDLQHKMLHNKKDCVMLFSEGVNTMVLRPLFKQVTYIPRKRNETATSDVVSSDAKNSLTQSAILGSLSPSWIDSILKERTKIVKPTDFKLVIGEHNRSLSEVKLELHCTGEDALDDVYLQIRTDNLDIQFYDSDKEYNSSLHTDLSDMTRRYQNRRVEEKRVTSHIQSINGGMMFSIIPFFVKTPFNCRSFDLLWSVNARGFKKDDSLHVTVNPELDYECKHTDDVDRSTEIIECVEDIER